MSKIKFSNSHILNSQFCFNQNVSRTLLNNRFIFEAGNDAAPKASESVTGKEKQSDQDAINEVAAQSPSNIASSATTRAAAIQTRYTKNSQILANLIQTDPLLNANLDQNTLPKGTQAANDLNNQKAA